MGLKSCEYGGKKRIVGGLLDQRPDAACLMRGQIVEDDDVSATEARHESALHPLGTPGRRHRTPGGAQRQPPIDAHRCDQRQVVPPVRGRGSTSSRPEAPTRASAPSPDWRRFVEKDHAADINAANPVVEGAPLRLDYRTVLLGRPRAFFLKTYPVRCNARRHSIDGRGPSVRRVRCSARQLLGRAVWALRDQDVQQRDVDRRVPAAAARRGSTVPRSRAPWTQRTNVLMWTEKRAATSAYVSALPCTRAPPAREARSDTDSACA